MAEAKGVRVVNGIKVDELMKTLEAMKSQPGLAKFNFRMRNQWLEASRSRGTIKDFHGANQDIEHKQPFVVDADDPPVLLGNDLGPNPVEYLLASLAACVTGSIVVHAAAKGIEIEEIESSLDGDINLMGYLGLDPDVRKGYQGINMRLKIKANVSDEQLQELARMGARFSPVHDSLTRGVPVNVTAERM